MKTISTNLADAVTRRNGLITKAKEMGERHRTNGGWKDGEERKAWETLNTDINAAKDEVRHFEDVNSVDARLQELDAEEKRSVNADRGIPGREDSDKINPLGGGRKVELPNEEERAYALAGFCKEQLGRPVKEKQRRAMQRCRITPGAKQLVFRAPSSRMHHDLANDIRNRNFDRAEQRNLSAYITGSGGVLAPPSFLKTLEINMLAFGGIRQVAEMMTTSSGERMSWPTVDDTGNKSTRIGEGGTTSTSTDPTFGAVYWDAYKYVSQCLVPYELIEDSFLDLPTVLGELLGTRHGRKTADDFTTGTGNSSPKGIITASSLGFTAANNNKIVYGDVVQLVHSVDPAYRDMPGVGFMCHDTAIMQLRLILDSYGRPLWQDGMGVGTPDKLFGYTVTRNQSMQNSSTISSGYKTLLFGDLSRYKIRRVNKIRFYRLQERYRDQDLDGFVILVREDGNLLTAGTVPVKYLQH